MASLLADARASNDLWEFEPALRHLRFYYPAEYRQQAVGAMEKKSEDLSQVRRNKTRRSNKSVQPMAQVPG
jgi:hypothetical protein